ncbi:hypothetical protein H7X68_01725 [Candidatus Saccharibacteria bacterium]|nr:hypothetical protein [Candidatus Saccharibacteria bacterium]
MSSEAGERTNGEWWMYEFLYGTEKAIQLDESLKDFDKLTPREIDAQMRKYGECALRLSTTLSALERLIDQDITVSHHAEGNEVVTTQGKLKRFSLEKGILAIKTDKGIVTQKYCKVSKDDRLGKVVTPTVSIETSQPYTF